MRKWRNRNLSCLGFRRKQQHVTLEGKEEEQKVPIETQTQDLLHPQAGITPLIEEQDNSGEVNNVFSPHLDHLTCFKMLEK